MDSTKNTAHCVYCHGAYALGDDGACVDASACRERVFRYKHLLDDGDPVPLLLWCPECGKRHVDHGVFASKAHHTHACQYCGHVWRPAVVKTVGVQFLPGFRSEEITDEASATPSNGG